MNKIAFLDLGQLNFLCCNWIKLSYHNYVIDWLYRSKTKRKRIFAIHLKKKAEFSWYLHIDIVPISNSLVLLYFASSIFTFHLSLFIWRILHLKIAEKKERFHLRDASFIRVRAWHNTESFRQLAWLRPSNTLREEFCAKILTLIRWKISWRGNL